MKKVINNENIRNIAIIAHVDHGKTTLVDAMFKQSGLFRTGVEVEQRIMDSMDLEKERGITIAAKNCSIVWNDVKINILDTPGHADFGGEVERALSMVDGAILLVDAAEGPLPQTSFVLKKALEKGIHIIVVINKIDRKDARPNEVLNEIYDLFIDLNANDKQIDFQYLFAIGRDGIVTRDIDEKRNDLHILFDTIIEQIPAPTYIENEPFQMLVSDLGYSDYIGRLAIGKIINGNAEINKAMVCIDAKHKENPFKILKLKVYDGMKMEDVDTAKAGDIVVISGMEDIKIGDTVCTKEFPKALKRIPVDEPTISMEFTINTSPFAGTEGKIVRASKIKERLVKETLQNVAIKLELTEDGNSFIVKGRGEFQMAILLETMRREGFELCVGRPKVIYKYKKGVKLEPIEHLTIECDEAFAGIVTEKLSMKKGILTKLVNISGKASLEFSIPSRSIIGYRDEFLTDTKGTGIMNALFKGYEEYRGDFHSRFTGSLVADRQGKAVAYALFKLEPRGRLFVAPGYFVYEGMVVGEHSKDNDLNVNPIKEKKLTNHRAAGKDENSICAPIKPMTLERAINFIKDDEMVEITPLTIRLHKRILSSQKRYLLRNKDV